MKKFCLAGLFICLLANLSSAQHNTSGRQENSPIVEQVVIMGNRRIPESTIHSMIKTRKGKRFDLAQLDTDVRAIYNTGHFDDVKVYAEDGRYNAKIVTFEVREVREKPWIHEVVYEGLHADIETKVIEELRKQKIEISKETEYDRVKMQRSAAAIQDILHREGYRNAKVNLLVEAVESEADEVKITFKIEL